MQQRLHGEEHHGRRNDHGRRIDAEQNQDQGDRSGPQQRFQDDEVEQQVRPALEEGPHRRQSHERRRQVVEHAADDAPQQAEDGEDPPAKPGDVQ